MIQNAPFVIAVLLLVDSFHFVFARLLRPYLPPVTAGLYVLGLATIETALFLALKRQIQWRVFWQHKVFFLSIGFLIAAATGLSYGSVIFIDPGTAALLAQTFTLFALGLSVFWLKEQLGRMEVVGAAVAIVGVFVISYQPGNPGENIWLGSLMVLVSTFVYALHAAVVKRYGGEMDFANFFLFRVASTTAFLILFAVGRAEFIWPRGQVWYILGAAAFVDVIVSRVLYYLALRRLQMSYHAIVLTLSPVITVLWSLALFGMVPSWQGLLGGTAVLVGIIIVTLTKRNYSGSLGRNSRN
jgi:O-acetylserine/cysteine efflux transporter